MASRYSTILATTVAAVCLLLTISEAAECGATVPSVQRIVGGDSVTEYTYPWFVALLRRNDFSEMSVVCGGSLITDRHFVTAAHCFSSRSASAGSEFRTVFKLVNRCESSSQVENVGISKVNVSPAYNPSTMEGDIAVVTLAKSVSYTTICLPESGHTNQKHGSVGASGVWSLLWNPFKRRRQGNQQQEVDGIVIGFGSTKVRSRYPCFMQEATVRILTDQQCKRTNLPSEFTRLPNTICAGILAGKTDSCDGDSGGPLMTVSSNGRYTIQGITSFGEGCGRKGLPGVYTKVSAYINWIQEVIKEDSGSSGSGSSSTSGGSGSNRPSKPANRPSQFPFPFPNFPASWQGLIGTLFSSSKRITSDNTRTVPLSGDPLLDTDLD